MPTQLFKLVGDAVLSRVELPLMEDAPPGEIAPEEDFLKSFAYRPFENVTYRDACAA